jgi:hypothetical protein
VSQEPSDFDLSAAWFRRAQSDTKPFIEAFAVRMEDALPGRVVVERRKDGLFSKHSHVVSVAIATERNKYVLSFEKSHLVASRMNIVGGINLKTQVMEIPEWLVDLNHDIRVIADRAGAAQNILHDFLMS